MSNDNKWTYDAFFSKKLEPAVARNQIILSEPRKTRKTRKFSPQKTQNKQKSLAAGPTTS